MDDHFPRDPWNYGPAAMRTNAIKRNSIMSLIEPYYRVITMDAVMLTKVVEGEISLALPFDSFPSKDVITINDSIPHCSRRSCPYPILITITMHHELKIFLEPSSQTQSRGHLFSCIRASIHRDHVTSIFDNEGKQVEKKYETVKEDNGGRD